MKNGVCGLIFSFSCWTVLPCVTSAMAKDSRELVQKLNQNYTKHYQISKSKGFDAQSLKADTVQGYQAMNKETAAVRQRQFAAISKKMY